MKALNHPKLTLVFWLIATVLLGVWGKNLIFRGDYKVYFEPDNPQLVQFDNMQAVFSKSDNVTFTVVPHKGTIYTPTTLALIQSLTEKAWQTPLSTRVDSVTNFQHTFAEEDDLIVEDLLSPFTEIDDQIDKIKTVVLSSPDLLGRLVSESGLATAVNVTVQLPEGDQTQDATIIAAFARSLKQEVLKDYPGHDIHLTGVVMMTEAFASEAQSDATTLVPGMFGVIALAIWLFTRSLFAMAVTMVTVVLTIIMTMGLAGALGQFLSTATVNVPTIVTTLAVADCIHLIIGIRYGLQQNMSLHNAIEYSVKSNTKPVVITSVTTALGFLTLNFSAVPVLADLGNLTAFGVMVACMLSLTLLPALFKITGVVLSTSTSEKSEPLEDVARFVCRNHTRILPFSVLVIGMSAILASDNELNDVAVHYFDNASHFRQAVNAHDSHFGGMSNIDFVVDSGESSGINAPEFLAKIEAFARWLRQQPEVEHVMSISDTYKRLNKNMHNDDESYYRLPEEKGLAAQYLLLYEMSLPYGLDINNQVDIDKASTRIMVTLQNLGSKEFTAFERRTLTWFKNLDPNTVLLASSPALMFAHIGETNMNSMVWGTLTALVLISGLLILALKSVKMGAISLLPNLIPALVGFGIWGAISAEINLALAVVLSMTLGIIVDDTVHFLSKYQLAREQGKTVEDSIVYAFTSVGRALIVTTIVLSAGFSVLTLSSIALNSHMGLLTVIIIVSALIIDLLFLPAFLMMFDKKTVPQETHHA